VLIKIRFIAKQIKHEKRFNNYDVYVCMHAMLVCCGEIFKRIELIFGVTVATENSYFVLDGGLNPPMKLIMEISSGSETCIYTFVKSTIESLLP